MFYLSLFNFSLSLVLVRGTDPATSEDESVENASVYSTRSNGAGCSDDEDSEESVGALEKYEEKLIQALENATEKSAQTRVNALQVIAEILSHRFVPDFVDDRKITIMDIIEKSVRRGKADEQALAAQLVPMLLLQLGGGADDVTKVLGPLLLTTAQNKSTGTDARAKCCASLGLLNFLGGDDIGDLVTLMAQLEQIFSGSYMKGDNKTASGAGPEASAMHCAALSAWGLLLTLIPSGDFCSLFSNNSFAP